MPQLPLSSITVINKDTQVLEDIKGLQHYIIEELTVREVVLTTDESLIVTLAKPDWKTLGRRLKKDMEKVATAIAALSHEDIMQFQQNKKMVVLGHEITVEEVAVTREYKGDILTNEPAWDEQILTVLNLSIDEKLKSEGMAREVCNRIQKLRKKAGIRPTDPIEVFYATENINLSAIIKEHHSFITKTIGVGFVHTSLLTPFVSVIKEETAEIEQLSAHIKLYLARKAFVINSTKLKESVGTATVDAVAAFLASREYSIVQEEANSKGMYNILF
jgi:isoleucyl-tRNA synthetase